MKVRNLPVEFITQHNVKGEITPLKFRLNDKDGATQVINIDKLIYSSSNKVAGKVICKYICQSCINNTLKELELHFRTEECKWILFKI